MGGRRRVSVAAETIPGRGIVASILHFHLNQNVQEW